MDYETALIVLLFIAMPVVVYLVHRTNVAQIRDELKARSQERMHQHLSPSTDRK